MVDFAKLKKTSGDLSKLKAELEKQNTKNNFGNEQDDERYWKPDVDKAGNGYAVIRFLPAPEVDGDDGTPWIKFWDHSFKGPAGWYIEKSITTIDQKDPASEYNTELWNQGEGSTGRKFVTGDGTNENPGSKRRLHYVSNIFVIEDSKHPENEGKVFLYKYGKKIFDKLSEAMHPPFPDKEAYNPFDFWTGASFKLKIRKKDGYRNYDACEFGEQKPISSKDKEIESIWKQEHSLLEIIAPSKFKTYEQLKRRLNKVMSLGEDTPGDEVETPKEATKKPAPKAEVKKTSKKKDPEPKVETDGEEDELEYFRKLSQED